MRINRRRITPINNSLESSMIEIIKQPRVRYEQRSSRGLRYSLISRRVCNYREPTNTSKWLPATSSVDKNLLGGGIISHTTLRQRRGICLIDIIQFSNRGRVYQIRGPCICRSNSSGYI